VKRRALVPTVEPEDASPELRAIYEAIAGARGSVANILRSHSLNPAALAAHFELYRTIQFGASPLARSERELVATVVSRTNGCHY
jgi:alkylhydroperoxidase family enzyme